MDFSIGHIVIETISCAIASSVPVMLYIAANKRAAKKDAQDRDDMTQFKLNAVITEQKYLRPHDHNEVEGALQFEGIIRKRNGSNGAT